jgi:hypothetical protein
LNLRGDAGTTLNSLLAVGQSTTVTFMVQLGGSTSIYQTATQIDGVSVTPRWQGTYAPTNSFASSINIYTFTIIKTAATPTYTVLASQIAY